MISCRGSPRPRITSAAVVTVERSTLRSFTGDDGGRSKAARKPSGLSRPMSFRVASKVMAMGGFPHPLRFAQALLRIRLSHRTFQPLTLGWTFRIPNLPFGNALLETPFHDWPERSFEACVPKPSLGTRAKGVSFKWVLPAGNPPLSRRRWRLRFLQGADASVVR